MTHMSRIFLIALGIFILFLGWFNVITGIFGLAGAEDFNFIIQMEDALALQTVSASSIVFNMVIRIILGFFFILIGNSILLRQNLFDEKFCRPCLEDTGRITRRLKLYGK